MAHDIHPVPQKTNTLYIQNIMCNTYKIKYVVLMSVHHIHLML